MFERADADKPFMGLTSFKGNEVTKSDVGIAKNYLDEDELSKLNSLVSGYFDFAEFRAHQHVPTYMADYVSQLDALILAAGARVLEGAGRISHAQAMEKADHEYRAYQVKTLSSAEKDYLEALKRAEKDLSNKEHGHS